MDENIDNDIIIIYLFFDCLLYLFLGRGVKNCI